MKNLPQKIMITYSFLMPAILLNCVGIVILNLINHMNVGMGAASWLEGFKDLSIVAAAFIMASFIPSIGYRRSLMLGIACEILACFAMAISPSLEMARVFFILCGIGFAFLKVVVYSSIGLLTENENQHASMMGIIEALYMLSSLGGFWMFSFFMKAGSWVTTFWVLGVLCIINLLLVIFIKLDESALKEEEGGGASPFECMKTDLKHIGMLFAEATIWMFIILSFSDVFVEQGINSWLPTYNSHVLHINEAQSVEIASLLAGCTAAGRLFWAIVMNKVKWVNILVMNSIIVIILLLISIKLSQAEATKTVMLSSWGDLPLVAYLLPIVGFFLGPMCPTLNSSILSRHPKRVQSAVTGLIIVSSSLGGTIGSRIIGQLFEVFGGLTAIKTPLFPLVLMIIVLIPYYRWLHKDKKRS